MSSSSRTTRSRSRSLAPALSTKVVRGDETVPASASASASAAVARSAAATGPAAASSSFNGAAASPSRRKAVIQDEAGEQEEEEKDSSSSSSAARRTSSSSRSAAVAPATASIEQSLIQTLDLTTPLSARYGWSGPGSSRATLGGAMRHLDLLTAHVLELRSNQAAAAEAAIATNDALTQALEGQARLRRMVKAQQLRSDRRWAGLLLFGLLLLVFRAPLGGVWSSVYGCVVAGPQQVGQCLFGLLDGFIPALTTGLWILVAPLACLLWVARVMGQYSLGHVSLTRACVSIGTGLALQMPLLAGGLAIGSSFLANLSAHPLFPGSPVANKAVEAAVMLTVATIDYTLVLAHQHMA